MSGLTATLLSAVSFGLYIVISKIALVNTPATIFGCLVTMLGSIFFGIYCYFKYPINQIQHIFKNNWRILILMSFFGVGANVSFFIGIKMSSANNLAIITRLDILFAAVIGSWLFGEKLVGYDWVAIALLVLASLRVFNVKMGDLSLDIGDIFLILHTLSVAINGMIIRYKLLDVPRPIIAFVNSGVSAWMLLIINIFANQTSLLLELEGIKIPLTICVFLLVFQLFTYYYGLQKLEVWLVRTLFLLTLVSSSIGSYFLLNERLAVEQQQGMLLVVFGVLIMSLRHKYKRTMLPQDNKSFNLQKD
ncbi:MAG: hypothetical protein JM58_10210 [Peptococcaceae bacterium BICA1-8]|nr:MAG: hypothetical protein JM58_10210 [Peptococcaceae bacterium BICA1-8]